MSPARAPRWPRDAVRMLVVDPRGGPPVEAPFDALADLLAPGDRLVVNQAATFPASLDVVVDGAPAELRLAQPPEGRRAWAVLFGAGDWRVRTEERAPAPRVRVGDALACGTMALRVVAVDASSPRLVEVCFEVADDAAVWSLLFERGRPVQYSYLRDAQPVWAVQTAFGARPWAVECPSAGRPLSFGILERLWERGVEVLGLTHAAGLSSTGDRALDARLPLPERYDIPSETVASIEAAHAEGARVIAVGTTVVRALEDCAARNGRLVAGCGVATLRLGPDHRLRVVDGLLTGMHDPTESHFELLRALAPSDALLEAHREATRLGFLGHEFGDAALIVPSPSRSPRPVVSA